MSVTVVIPTYKRRKYLRHALVSCARQTIPKEALQVVLVNDGAPGLNRHSARDLWKSVKCPAAFQYARITHAGLSAAVNAGLRYATGTYYTVLPDDDMLDPRHLEVMMTKLDETPSADVAWCLPKYIDGNGKVVAHPSRLRKLKSYMRSHRELKWEHIVAGDGLRVHGAGLLYRREEVSPAGGWDTSLPTAEEFEYHLRLLHVGHRFVPVLQQLVMYREHESNKSATYRKTGRAKYMPKIYAKFFKTGKPPVR